MSVIDSLKSMFGGSGKKSGAAKNEKAALSDADREMLIGKIRQSDLFKDLPQENLEEMLSRMVTVPVSEGDVLIKQGDEGDFYYLLVEGLAKVLRKGDDDSEAQVVAELDEPKGFGEEALISNAKRNATIIMKTDGVVMKFSKDNFNDYIKEPILDWYPAAQAQKEIGQGAKWVDVRDEENSQSHLPGALALPIDAVRQRAAEVLNKETLYICYCENGRLSSSGAFVLKQLGYKAGVLRGGLQSLKRAGLA
jgi:rhodanese-related sulfurtransferase